MIWSEGCNMKKKYLFQQNEEIRDKLENGVGDKFKKRHTCQLCGCIMDYSEYGSGFSWWFHPNDFACELCRLEYQDAFKQ